MDEKVTIGKAVVAGYRFAFGRLGAVAGAAWLPTLVMIAVLTLIGYLNFQLNSALSAKAAGTALGAAFGIMPVTMLVEAVFEGMAVAGVMAVALERRQPSVAYFSFGPAALRMMAAYVVVDLIVVALIAVLLGVFIGASFAMGIPPPPAGSPWMAWLTNPLQNVMMCAIVPRLCPSPLVLIGLVLVGLAEFGAFLYVMTRLTFFLPAIVVAEEQINFGRSWRLSRGNFWRVLAVWLGVLIPMTIAVALVEHFATKLLLPGLGTGAARDARAITLALQGMPAVLLIRSLITMADRTLTIGLESGAQAKAYNELTMSDAPSVF